MLPWFIERLGQGNSCRSQTPDSKCSSDARRARRLKGFLAIGAFLMTWFMILPTGLPEQRYAMLSATTPMISIATVFDNYAVDSRLTTS